MFLRTPAFGADKKIMDIHHKASEKSEILLRRLSGEYLDENGRRETHPPLSGSDEELLDAYSRAVTNVRGGDIILSIDDHRIETIDDLHRYLAKHFPRTPLTLTIFRKNERVSTRVIPGEV